MAIQMTFMCNECNRSVTEVRPNNDHPEMCYECVEQNAIAEKARWLDEFEQKTLEEKLRLIAEWMYDHRQVPHGYISPPRF